MQKTKNKKQNETTQNQSEQAHPRAHYLLGIFHKEGQVETPSPIAAFTHFNTGFLFFVFFRFSYFK